MACSIFKRMEFDSHNWFIFLERATFSMEDKDQGGDKPGPSLFFVWFS
jgi:hypothetical protein